LFVDFFIRRPIFATVCALLIILAGAIVIPSLPIALYPQLAPPQVTVSSVYIAAAKGNGYSAHQVPVTLGETQGNTYPVLSGLNPGDRVIISGLQFLQEGAPVKPMG
jgi:multidrug efflux pump subunit AcrA (membrane-fusion protein)